MRITLEGLVTNYLEGQGGGLQHGRRASEVLSLRKEDEKCFSHTEGGAQKFSPYKGGGGRKKFYPVLGGGGGEHKFWTRDFPIL